MRRAAPAGVILVLLALPWPTIGADGPAPPVRTSIHVVGNDALTAENGVRSGSGTPDDPYVLGGFRIVQTRAFALRLEDTTAHVVVEDVDVFGFEGRATRLPDCLVMGGFCEGSRGIDLANVSNVTVRRTAVATEGFGVLVSRSADVTLDTVATGTGLDSPVSLVFGVYVIDSERVTVERLTTDAAEIPVFIRRGRDVAVRDSTFRGPAHESYFEGGTNGTFDGIDFRESGLDIGGEARDVAVLRSRFGDEELGLHSSFLGTARPVGVLVCGSTFERNAGGHGGALMMRRAQGLRVVGNSFRDNAFPLEAQLSTDVEIHKNLFTGSTVRSALVGRYDADAHGNAFLETKRVFLGAGTRGEGNWWGAADGPSLDGSGTGSPVDVDATNTTFTPWLTSPPAAGVGSVDCDAELAGWRS